MNNCADKAYKLGNALKQLENVNGVWDTYEKLEYKDQKWLNEMQSMKATALENVKKARADLEKCLENLKELQ
jgi:hypothetical protein